MFENSIVCLVVFVCCFCFWPCFFFPFRGVVVFDGRHEFGDWYGVFLTAYPVEAISLLGGTVYFFGAGSHCKFRVVFAL